MTATLVNALSVLLGGGIGLLMRLVSRGKNLSSPPEIAGRITAALGLCVCIIGISGALKGDMMLLVVSLALGTLTGELLKIDDRLGKLGESLQKRFSKDSDGNFTKGFVAASLLFCVGAMSVTGSLDAGLRHEYSTILTKSVLDGISSVMFAYVFGVGVLFSIVIILLYQGGIELAAGYIGQYLADGLITQVSAAGSVMIFAIGLNMAAKTEIKTANLLPGLIFAGLYYCLFLQ